MVIYSLTVQDACLYELDDDNVLSAVNPAELEDQPILGASQSAPEPSSLSAKSIGDEVKALGYGDGAKGTPGIIHSLRAPADLLGSQLSSPSELPSTPYVSIIRQLPSRRLIDILVRDFFNNVAWHYDIVDKPTFAGQLFEWNGLTHAQLKQAPGSLPPSLRSFPALLLQVLAQALLFQPLHHNRDLDDLKYAADTELSDRAVEYSDAGRRLVSLFGKNDLSLTIVQAELLRACLEKTTGAVTEAWHTLGVAIRNAQELGFHHKEPAGHPAEHELGRKVWLILHLWDGHMAIVLGRPMSTKVRPDDVPLPMSWSFGHSTLSQPQPRDVILCGYHTAHKFLQEIHDLERADDYRTRVDNIHAQLVTNIRNLPAWSSPHRSRHGEPPWLSAALEIMFTNVQFVCFALHRPFVFAEPSSRHRASDSAMQILESQARLFNLTPPLQYKSFSFIFATFDAMVLIAAVHIRFPEDYTEQLPTSIKHLRWGLDRLYILRTVNKLASSALNIVQWLFHKVLATVSPMQLHSLRGDAQCCNLMDLEIDMPHADWNDGTLQPGFGDLLPPRPLTALLSDGFPDVLPSRPEDSFDKPC